MNKLLGLMAITIYNQLYSAGSVADLIERYDRVLNGTTNIVVFAAFLSTMKTVAAGITVILFLIDLGNKSTEKNFNTEQLFKSMLRYFTAYIFILQSSNIINYMLDICSATAAQLGDSSIAADFFENSSSRSMLINGIRNLDFGDQLGFIAWGILPWIICMIAQLVVQFVLITRVLELTVRMIFAPIALADVYREGTRSPGIIYIKKILALGLQVLVIVLLNVASQSILQSINADNAVSVIGALKTVEISGDQTEALVNGSLVFTKESITEFLTNLLSTEHYPKMLGIILAKLGMILNSLPLCEEITGAR